MDEDSPFPPVPAPGAPNHDPRYPSQTQTLPKIGEENPLERDVNWPIIRPPQVPFAAAGNDAFRPQQHDGFDEVQLQGLIREYGETEFTTKNGWIYWRGAVVESSSSSSSSSSSEGSTTTPPTSGGDSASSSKSTCIVQVPEWFWESRYTALFCVEAPEVRFLDWRSFELTGRITKVPMDPKFTVVCEAGTIEVSSIQGDKPGSFGGKVDGDWLTIDAGIFWRWKSKTVVVGFSAIRKGFATNTTNDPFFDPRFPERTAAQFKSNEIQINKAYDQVGKARRPN